MLLKIDLLNEYGGGSSTGNWAGFIQFWRQEARARGVSFLRS